MSRAKNAIKLLNSDWPFENNVKSHLIQLDGSHQMPDFIN